MPNWLEITLIIAAVLAGVLGSGVTLNLVWQRWRKRNQANGSFANQPHAIKDELRGDSQFVPKKPKSNIVDSAVPKSEATQRLSEGEKKALEQGEPAEHSDGRQREQLLKKAARSAKQDQ